MNKLLKDMIVSGGALFAMFFGAGNLIFPPSLGFQSGTHWFICMISFFITGVGLPILGVMAIALTNSFEEFAGKVSPVFSKVLGTIIVLSIGPLLAIPRTGATVFEVGIKPAFPHASPIIVSFIYFAVTLFFTLKPSTIVEKIGKYLTPILLFIISLIIFKGVSSPLGTPVATGYTNPFSQGFAEGYQTMDALAAILFGGIILNAIAAKGYSKRSDQIKLTCLSGLIAGCALMFVYGGLLYLGATGSSVIETGITKSELIITITHKILGSFGQSALGLTVSAACLTTSIALTAVVGNYFEKLSNGKLKYIPVVIITTIFSAVMSVSGVETIVAIAVPLLITSYPVVIVLIFMTLFCRKLSSGAFRGAVAGALIVSNFDAMAYLKLDTGIPGKLISGLPFADSGFSWIIPAITLAVLGELLTRTVFKPTSLTQA